MLVKPFSTGVSREHPQSRISPGGTSVSAGSLNSPHGNPCEEDNDSTLSTSSYIAYWNFYYTIFPKNSNHSTIYPVPRCCNISHSSLTSLDRYYRCIDINRGVKRVGTTGRKYYCNVYVQAFETCYRCSRSCSFGRFR